MMPMKNSNVCDKTNVGLAAGGSGNSQSEWERNGDKTCLNLAAGMRMRMNQWERNRLELN